MKIKIQGINTEVSANMRQLVHQKLAAKLDQLLLQTEEDLKICHVKIEQRPDWGVELIVNLKLADHDLHAQSRRDKLTTAVVEVREELENQIKQFQQKRSTH